MKTTTTVNIDKNEVCRYLGYKDRTPPTSTSSFIDSQITRSYKLIKPAYTYSLKAIKGIKGRKVFTEDSLVFISSTISYVLSDCEYMVVCLATIGSDLENENSKLMKKGDMLPVII